MDNIQAFLDEFDALVSKYGYSLGNECCGCAYFTVYGRGEEAVNVYHHTLEYEEVCSPRYHPEVMERENQERLAREEPWWAEGKKLALEEAGIHPRRVSFRGGRNWALNQQVSWWTDGGGHLDTPSQDEVETIVRIMAD